MTTTVNIPETLEQLTSLLKQIQSGEEVLLAQDGVTVARLIPLRPLDAPRVPGQDKGKVVISPDFNAPLPEDIINNFLHPNSPVL